MTLNELFSQVFGVKDSNDAQCSERIPHALDTLYRLAKKLESSILRTDVRILEIEETYTEGPYTVFAEESQNVVLWAFSEPADGTACYKLVNFNPIKVELEDGDLASTILELVVNNAL